MAANKISAQISKALPEATDQAIHLIAALTGEDPAKLAKMHSDELFTYLSFLLKCEKQKIQNLLREHNQNQEIDAVSLAKLWKLVSRGTIHGKKKPFASLEEKTFEYIKIQMAKLTDKSTYQAEKNLQNVSIQNLKKNTAKVDMHKIIHRLTLMAANNNAPSLIGHK